MDVHSKEVRSYNMSRIKGKGTKPEETVRKYLFSRGFRYRKNDKRLPGKPDIVLPKYKTAIFVNGCFWHGHEGCKYYVLPKTNTEFWKTKIERNRERDLDRRIKLRDMGWHVIQFWECQLKPKVREENLQGLLYTLNKIMLLNYQSKPYRIEETVTAIAAENFLEYRKKALSLPPETDKKA